MQVKAWLIVKKKNGDIFSCYKDAKVYKTRRKARFMKWSDEKVKPCEITIKD